MVCVDDADQSRMGSKWLCAGTVYTISWAGWAVHDGRDYVGVLVDEADRGLDKATGKVVPYSVRRFRPAVPPRTLAQDVSVFNHLLLPEREKSDA